MIFSGDRTAGTINLAIMSASASLHGRALARPLHAKTTAPRRRTRARGLTRAAVDPERDVILVSGCRERIAQCCVDQLSKNERSAGTAVKVTLPHDAYVGVKNPLNAMAKDLVYPDKPMIDCLGALDAVECVDESTDEFKGCLKDCTGVILASEYAPTLLQTAEDLCDRIKAGAMPKLRRVIVLSHIGVERRDVDPWKLMNRKTMVGTGVIGGTPRPGGAPLDRWLDAETLVKATLESCGGADESPWSYTIVRVGDLRGNGPTSVTYGDAMLTLVDNAFDVRMQDIEMEEGDAFEGFTKRQSVAVVLNRMLTTQSYRVINKTFSCISTGPVDRERRKGWDVAKGRSPPPIEDKVVDEELQPKEEEENVPAGAPVPT